MHLFECITVSSAFAPSVWTRCVLAPTSLVAASLRWLCWWITAELLAVDVGLGEAVSFLVAASATSVAHDVVPRLACTGAFGTCSWPLGADPSSLPRRRLVGLCHQEDTGKAGELVVDGLLGEVTGVDLFADVASGELVVEGVKDGVHDHVLDRDSTRVDRGDGFSRSCVVLVGVLVVLELA